MAHFALDRPSGPRLVVLQLATEFADLGFAQRIDRKMIAALAVARDLAVGQEFCDAFPPVLFFCLKRAIKVTLRFCAVKQPRSLVPLPAGER